MAAGAGAAEVTATAGNLKGVRNLGRPLRREATAFFF